MGLVGPLNSWVQIGLAQHGSTSVTCLIFFSLFFATSPFLFNFGHGRMGLKEKRSIIRKNNCSNIQFGKSQYLGIVVSFLHFFNLQLLTLRLSLDIFFFHTSLCQSSLTLGLLLLLMPRFFLPYASLLFLQNFPPLSVVALISSFIMEG